MSINSRRGPKWQKIREAILQRDGYVCTYQMGNCSYDEDLTVDHRIPLATFEQQYPDEDPDSEWNLTTACRSCNGSKKDKALTRVSWLHPDAYPNGMQDVAQAG